MKVRAYFGEEDYNMRIGLVVDSMCDLPSDFVRDNNIVVLPITVTLGSRRFVDTRDGEATQEFYRQHLASAGDAETSPLPVEEIKRLFLDRLVIEYDYVFCLCLASSRSPVFEHAQAASLAILNEYKPYRAKAGLTSPFALRVVDTQSLFVAQGVLAYEVVRMIKAGEGPLKIRERIDSLIPQTYGYMLPKSLYHIRARASKKGDKSVGWFKYAVAGALDIKPLIRSFRNDTGPVANLRHHAEGTRHLFEFGIKRIQQGLLTGAIGIDYAGELSELAGLPGYSEFRAAAEQAGIEVFESFVSITGAINVGEGSIGMAFCAPEHVFE
jgi:DegV family protein with EDD domain